jgi:hypothetical protein
MTKTLCALAALLALVVAGCGSGSGSSGADTAKLAPASSFLYAEVSLDPSGSQQAGVRSILGDLPGSGPPKQRLNDLLERASKSGKSPFDYEKDVKPWLGDKAAVFVAPPAAGAKDPAWAAVVATSDESKAKDALKKLQEPGDRKATYNGTDYVIDKHGDASGLVDSFFVSGSNAGFKAAVDAGKKGTLSGSDRYKQATKDASDERIALVYEDIGGLVQAAAAASGQSLGPAAGLFGRMLGGEPVVATVKAEQQALVVDGSLIPKSTGLNLMGKSTPLLGEVPADSWLAFGQADFGAAVKSLIGMFAGLAGGEAQLEQQLRNATGLDLNRDLLSWIGDVAPFVKGDSKQSIGGGALIQSKDPAASRRALTKLSALVARSDHTTQVSAAKVGSARGYRLKSKDAPQGVYMVQSGDKVALTYGSSSAASALSGKQGLAEAPGFTDAAGKLGDAYSPSFYVAIPPIVRLADSFGASGADWNKAKPYLTILDYVISGSAQADGQAASRTRIGFKPHD